MKKFEKLGLSEDTLKTIQSKGFEKPTPVQEKTIPILLEGKYDVVAQSQTGTGKTICFALPIIESIQENSNHVQAIILAPTRELAVQVAKEIESLKGNKHIKILPVYGGSSIGMQIKELRRGVDIIVGTPGRVIDLLERKEINITKVSFAVLDEADEMLNMGFIDDIRTILSKTAVDKKMLLFSATMPKEILRIAKDFMREYKLVEIENKDLTLDAIEQIYYQINSDDRYEGLRRILAINNDFYGIIFCRTKAEVDELSEKLNQDEYKAASLHGDITQIQRERILEKFKQRKITALIATDVAARGINVNDLTHVINYSLPQTPEDYVHRIGRTGRAGKKGTAITFLIPSEKKRFGNFQKISNHKIQKREIPSVSDIVETRKTTILSEIDDFVKNHKSPEFDEFSAEILKDLKPERAVSSLVKFIFKKEIKQSDFKEISKFNENERSSDYTGRRYPSRQRKRSKGSFKRRDSKPSFGRARPRKAGRKR